MSDDTPTTPEPSAAPEPFGPGTEGAREAAAELGKARSEGRLVPKDAPAAEPEDRKIELEGTEPLSAREAGRKLSALRRDEAERERAYAEAAGQRVRAEGLAAPSAEQPAAADLEPQRQAAETEQRRQSEAQIAAEQARIASEDERYQHMKWSLNQEAVKFQQGYADIRSPEDLQRLALPREQGGDPVRHAQFMDHFGALQHAASQLEHYRHAQQQEHQRVEAEQREANKARTMRIAAENEQYLVQELHPELKDPAKYREAQDDVALALRHVDLAGEEAEPLRRGQEAISLLDWRTLEIVRLAGKQLRAEEALEKSRATTRNGKLALPPVQRPGVSHPSDGKGDQIATLERAFTRASGRKQLEIGAALLAARRR